MAISQIAQRFTRRTKSGRNRLLMTLLVRNEEDILPHVLEYHRAQGVDHFIVTDNLSEDRTPDILRFYKKLGWLTVIQENNDDYDQQAWVTRMARIACDPIYGAGWIMHCDADEFWRSPNQSLKTFFRGLDKETNIVSAPRHDFVAQSDQKGQWHADMIYRKTVSLNPRGGPLPPKVAHRPNRDAIVSQGNHAVDGFKSPKIKTDGIEILHFPVRSQRQIEQKIEKGGAAYERNTVQPKTVAVGWRRLYEELLEKGSLGDHFTSISYAREEFMSRVEAGELMVDDTIAEFFKVHEIQWPGNSEM